MFFPILDTVSFYRKKQLSENRQKSPSISDVEMPVSPCITAVCDDTIGSV